MDAVREQLKRPLVVGIIGLVVGILFGLIALGWWLFPVKWVDASPADLNYASKVDYMRSSIEAFAQNGNVAKAKARYDALGSDANKVLLDVANKPEGVSLDQIRLYSAAVSGAAPVAEATSIPGAAVASPPAGTAIAPGGAAPTQAAGTAGATKTRSFLSSLLPILCVIVLVLGAGAIVTFILRNRGAAPAGPSTPAEQAQQAARQAAWTDYQSTGAEPPMAQFMASYKLGDDLFDDSFSIDSPAGEFMGECGVGISETIGVGDPKKVTAFEVWLFDKNDIQTVTKVLMSNHAYSDDAIRQRLAAKGEPVLVEPGTEAVLETQTLQLLARVVDMGYGEGALPGESFFDRFILELAIWPKS
ncbi:MAG TPA: hypothetical protein VF498_05910 [Anaerolineales bacterium]